MFLELSPTCPLSSSYARLRERGEEAELNVESVRRVQAKHKEALALEFYLWLQFYFYGSLNCL